MLILPMFFLLATAGNHYISRMFLILKFTWNHFRCPLPKILEIYATGVALDPLESQLRRCSDSPLLKQISGKTQS